MWHSDDSYHSKSDDSGHNGAYIKKRSNSPPLEGGESLCEFYVDCKNDAFLQGAGDINRGTALHETSPDAKNAIQHDRFPASDEPFSSKALFTFLGQGFLPANTFTQSFLQSILSSVDSHDSVVANAWMETLLDVIDSLPKEVIKSEILTLAVNKGQLSQPISSRLICCRMLGKLCTKFEPYIIKKELLPVVLSLCQDVDYEVRGCMCLQLDVVAKGIGLETTKNAILPQLVELSNDEESYVRVAGIETVVLMLPLLDDETCTQAIIPLVQKFCENAIRAEDSTVVIVSKHIGRLCHGLAVNFSHQQKLWFLKFYRNLAALGLPLREKDNSSSTIYSPMPDIVPQLDNIDRHRESRRCCAHNMPAMSLFIGPESFETELHSTFSELCKDPFPDVRKTIASGFYEVTKFLNLQSAALLPDLVCLLKDESLEILKQIIPSLPEILRIVCHSANSNNEYREYTTDLIQALKTCEETISLSTNWRLHAEFLTQISCLRHCLSSEILYTNFVPLLFVKLHTARPIPCRVSSAYSLLILLRNTKKLEQRNGIINELIRDLCNGRSCHKRMLFIKVCEIVLDVFSKAFFKKHFFRSILQLSGDNVPNIRLRLCRILPRLKNLMKLPKDSVLLHELESCVRSLMTDEKDVDVMAAVNLAIEELDKIEVPTEPLSRCTSCVELEVDLEDMHKEEEERRLLEMELNLHDENYDNRCVKAHTETRSLTRQGKIPVRKSGTLPKPSKSKEFKSNTLTKAVSSQSKRHSVANISKYDSSTISSFGKPSTHMKKSSTMDKISSYPSKSNIIPPSKSIHNFRSSPKTVQTSNIPKMSIDRCPSPMPPLRRYSDTNLHAFVAAVPPKSQENVAKPSENSTSIPNQTSVQAAKGSTVTSIKTPVSFLDTMGKNRTPMPSPEVSKRSSSLTSGSRIPTPNSDLK